MTYFEALDFCEITLVRGYCSTVLRRYARFSEVLLKRIIRRYLPILGLGIHSGGYRPRRENTIPSTHRNSENIQKSRITRRRITVLHRKYPVR